MNSSPQRRPRSWRGLPLMVFLMLAAFTLQAQNAVKGKITDETGDRNARRKRDCKGYDYWYDQRF